MNRRIRAGMLAALFVALPACSSMDGGGYGFGSYGLIRAREVAVGNDSLRVTPPREWNKQWARIFADVSEVEDWTQNGPLLDSISFVTGLDSGETLVRQTRRDDRQVPKFRANMTAPEIAAMIESLFRVRGGTVDFKTLGLAPRTFLGYPGFQYDFEHLDGDEVWRRGRVVGANVDGKLYLILLDAARSHYYDATLPDFEALVTSARRVK